MSNNVLLKELVEADLRELWEISYGPQADLTWMKFNGPYFKDPVETWLEFSKGYGRSLLNSSMSKGIIVNGRIIGLVTAYWADSELKQWLTCGGKASAVSRYLLG